MSYTKHSTNAKDLVDENFGHDIVETIDKIADINKDKHNAIIILNEPGNQNNIAAMLFSEEMCIDPSTGRPMLDNEKINLLSDEEKKKKIHGIMDTMIGFIKTIDSLKTGLLTFTKYILEIEKECSKSKS